MKKIIIRLTALAFITLVGTIGFSGAYFSDAKVVSGNTFSTGYWIADHLVINEVYYYGNSKGNKHGHEDDDEYRHPVRYDEKEKSDKSEWIELYNPTNEAINLKGYTIVTSETVHKITATRWLRAGGFMLVSHDSSTWHQWDNPNAEKINLGGCPEKWFKDTGDSIILKDKGENLVDQLSYGDDLSVFDPSIPLVSDGHSFERKTPGYDTGLASDFVEKALPTPGH